MIEPPATSRPAFDAGLLVLGLALVAYVVLAFGYISLTPVWQNPDEPAHYNYVAFVAQNGGLPELKPGDWDSQLLERLKNGAFQPGDSISSIRYEFWQPPLIYLLAVPVFRLGPASDPSEVLFRLRALDALFGALTLGIAYFVAREVLPRHLAPSVPLTMVGVPMFLAVSAAFSADPLANLLSAAILLAMAHRLRAAASDDRAWAAMTGALVGLGLLTKLAIGIFVPLVLIVIVVRSVRARAEAAISLAVTGLVVAPWLVHQVTTYGWADPLAFSRHSAVVSDQPRFPGLSAEYVGQFLTISFHSFWAQFGWMAVVAPARLYWIWGGLVLTALAGLALHWRRLRAWSGWLVIGVVGAALVAYLGYNLTFEQPQGRYLFTALTPIAILLVAGWAAWWPRRLQAPIVVLVALLLVALNAYSLWRVLVPGFAPTG